FAQAARSLSSQEQEHFLATAKLMEIHTLAQGVTGSQRATLSDGSLTHDAHIQTIDEFQTAAPTASGYEANFRDSFKFNVAAYRLNRMLGLDMIPATVE